MLWFHHTMNLVHFLCHSMPPSLCARKVCTVCHPYTATSNSCEVIQFLLFKNQELSCWSYVLQGLSLSIGQWSGMRFGCIHKLNELNELNELNVLGKSSEWWNIRNEENNNNIAMTTSRSRKVIRSEFWCVIVHVYACMQENISTLFNIIICTLQKKEHPRPVIGCMYACACMSLFVF